MKDHKDLDVWKRSMDLVEEIYTVTRDFPKDEIYALTSQLRRSAVSIPSNISEGAARNSDKEFLQFLYISLGSASEAETQLLIAQRLKYSSDIPDTLNRLSSVKQMINGLIRHYKTGLGNREPERRKSQILRPEPPNTESRPNESGTTALTGSRVQDPECRK